MFKSSQGQNFEKENEEKGPSRLGGCYKDSGSKTWTQKGPPEPGQLDDSISGSPAVSRWQRVEPIGHSVLSEEE